MHLRPMLAAGGGTISDTLHVAVWTPLTAVLFVGAMGFGTFALGRQFRLYSAASIVALLVFGSLTASASTGLSKNLPTPWLGVWERINIAVFIVWVLILAVAVLRTRRSGAATHGASNDAEARRLAA